MHERFREPEKAACYVGMGATREYAACRFCVTLRAGKRARQLECDAAGLAQSIELLARKFPRASVYYYPTPLDGLLAEVHCHCEEYVRRTCCFHGDDRPVIFIRILGKQAGFDMRPRNR